MRHAGIGIDIQVPPVVFGYPCRKIDVFVHMEPVGTVERHLSKYVPTPGRESPGNEIAFNQRMAMTLIVTIDAFSFVPVNPSMEKV